jgi:hypothetical protein
MFAFLLGVCLVGLETKTKFMSHNPRTNVNLRHRMYQTGMSPKGKGKKSLSMCEKGAAHENIPNIKDFTWYTCRTSLHVEARGHACGGYLTTLTVVGTYTLACFLVPTGTQGLLNHPV